MPVAALSVSSFVVDAEKRTLPPRYNGAPSVEVKLAAPVLASKLHLTAGAAPSPVTTTADMRSVPSMEPELHTARPEEGPIAGGDVAPKRKK